MQENIWSFEPGEASSSEEEGGRKQCEEEGDHELFGKDTHDNYVVNGIRHVLTKCDCIDISSNTNE